MVVVSSEDNSGRGNGIGEERKPRRLRRLIELQYVHDDCCGVG